VAPRREPAGRRGVELVFRLHAPRPARYLTRGIRVDYRVGDEPHRRIIPNGFAACAVPRGARLQAAARARREAVNPFDSAAGPEHPAITSVRKALR
jgi:hypothetical protein